MEYSKSLHDKGFLPVFHLENETIVNNGKPSSHLLKSKNFKRTIKGLKEIEQNHNHSWYQEIYNRAQENLKKEALFYRGHSISFRQMINNANRLAKALAQIGIQQGDEIGICMSNVPELVYLLLAINKLSAKINSFGDSYDKDYISEILDGVSKKVFFATDDIFANIAPIVKTKNFKHCVVISLTDSQPCDRKNIKEYEKSLDEYYFFEDKFFELKEIYPFIERYNVFCKNSLYFGEEIVDNGTLDTEFLITYTSGSTKIGVPKAIVHTNRSIITMGMFHDPELSGNPRMEKFRALAIIHADSNTDIITSISDSLMQLWSVALEPTYDYKNVLDILMLNKPNQVSLTAIFWIEAAKQFFIDKKYHDKNGNPISFPFIFAGLVCGEGISLGEEYLINRFLKETKAGSGVNLIGNFHLPYTCIASGGGDCEHGGIYYTLWRKLAEKRYPLYYRNKNYGMGLKPVPFAQISTFKQLENGLWEECDYEELGVIAANVATSTRGYKNNIQATNDLIIKDINGKEWITCNVRGFIDKKGTVHVNGRINPKEEQVLKDRVHSMDALIQSDFKNILSCTSVNIKTKENKNAIITNIQMQLDSTLTQNEIIEKIDKILNEKFLDIKNMVKIKVWEQRDNFPITTPGKRNLLALEQIAQKENS